MKLLLQNFQIHRLLSAFCLSREFCHVVINSGPHPKSYYFFDHFPVTKFEIYSGIRFGQSGILFELVHCACCISSPFWHNMLMHNVLLLFLCRMATTRTPVARIDHIHRVRRGKKRPHDDDLARRAYFSALCDEHDKAPASELMAKANTHYKSLGQKPLTVRTAQLWRREYQEHPSAFAAGPNFLRARRCKLSDQQIEEARQFVENHPWNSMREAADKLQARNIPINKTWLSDVRRSDPNPERLKVCSFVLCCNCY